MSKSFDIDNLLAKLVCDDGIWRGRFKTADNRQTKILILADDNPPNAKQMHCLKQALIKWKTITAGAEKLLLKYYEAKRPHLLEEVAAGLSAPTSVPEISQVRKNIKKRLLRGNWNLVIPRRTRKYKGRIAILSFEVIWDYEHSLDVLIRNEKACAIEQTGCFEDE